MFPELDREAVEALRCHNSRWLRRHANWLSHAIPPWWGENLIITPCIRETYEKWLPVGEFLDSISEAARAYLPDESWLPFPLRHRTHLSMPDLWAAMPRCFGGRLCFSEEELLPLLCAMADPPRFGTNAERYPEELLYLINNRRDGMEVLDVGCGVGLNTLEMASALRGASVTGITAEPLEVWMAANRRLPHDKRREAAMRHFDGNAAFSHGTAENFSGSYDFIVCNGLVGGRFLCDNGQYAAFLRCCSASLRHGGRVLLADHFHDGFKRNMPRFRKMAAERDFACIESHRGFMELAPKRLEG